MSEETQAAVDAVTTDTTAAVAAVETTVEATPVAVEAAAEDVAHDAERDTRGLIHRLWDEADADIAKGIEWFKAEIAKL